MYRALRSVAFAAVAALGLSSCSDDDGTINAQSPETISYASGLNVNLSSMTRTATGLYYKDTLVGTGAVAVNGKTLSVRYTGYLNNGEIFDVHTSGVPFTFELGAGEVIDGWDQGFAGMKVGGKRQLVIPPALGYGNFGNGDIPGGSVLIFTVELMAVEES